MFAVLAWAALPAVAAAQTTGPQRPSQALFGELAPQPRTPDTVTFGLTLARAYDDDVYAELRPGGTPLGPTEGGYYTSLFGEGHYARRGQKTDFLATAASAAWYYGELRQFKSVSHWAALGLSSRVSRRTTVSLNGAADYSPSYLYRLFPTVVEPGLVEASPALPDYATTNLESVSYTATARWQKATSERGSIAIAADARYLDYLHRNEMRTDGRMVGLTSDFTSGLTRRSTLAATYRYQTGDLSFGGAMRTTEHEVTIGVDYSRELRGSRRAGFNVSLGPSAVDVPVFARSPLAAGWHYRLSGEVGGSYEFGRSWTARANYRRGVEWVLELTQPVFAQGGTAVVEGLFTRRLDFRASARYATGASAYNRDSMYFDTYTGDARLRFALTRTLAAYAEYLYYFYDFRGSSTLPPGLPRALERQGARVGVTVWVRALPR